MRKLIISKMSNNGDLCKLQEYYYPSAREGMFDLINNMVKNGIIDTLLLPGYIGWSPNEGSGIFDPVDKIKGLSKMYYKMTGELCIDGECLSEMIKSLKGKKIAVLIVNYFGFVDPNINNICKMLKLNSAWIIEDNAHGFFTYWNREQRQFSDATFFSLHKMFPFEDGGSLLINNVNLKNINYSGITLQESKNNPWIYDIKAISRLRLENYNYLQQIIKEYGDDKVFVPLKSKIDEGIIPQSFPIKILKGNRNEIYTKMNDAGYGVVSLYHTLIEPLRNSRYQEACELSSTIMNLPIHQDVNRDKYIDMIKLLVQLCNITENN